MGCWRTPNSSFAITKLTEMFVCCMRNHIHSIYIWWYSVVWRRAVWCNTNASVCVLRFCFPPNQNEILCQARSTSRKYLMQMYWFFFSVVKFWFKRIYNHVLLLFYFIVLNFIKYSFVNARDCHCQNVQCLYMLHVIIWLPYECFIPIIVPFCAFFLFYLWHSNTRAYISQMHTQCTIRQSIWWNASLNITSNCMYICDAVLSLHQWHTVMCG